MGETRCNSATANALKARLKRSVAIRVRQRKTALFKMIKSPWLRLLRLFLKKAKRKVAAMAAVMAKRAVMIQGVRIKPAKGKQRIKVPRQDTHTIKIRSICADASSLAKVFRSRSEFVY